MFERIVKLCVSYIGVGCTEFGKNAVFRLSKLMWNLCIQINLQELLVLNELNSNSLNILSSGYNYVYNF